MTQFHSNKSKISIICVCKWKKLTLLNIYKYIKVLQIYGNFDVNVGFKNQISILRNHQHLIDY